MTNGQYGLALLAHWSVRQKLNHVTVRALSLQCCSSVHTGVDPLELSTPYTTADRMVEKDRRYE